MEGFQQVSWLEFISTFRRLRFNWCTLAKHPIGSETSKGECEDWRFNTWIDLIDVTIQCGCCATKVFLL